jgi:hypothetical protein
MRISRRCELCDLALDMNMSEAEFTAKYDPMERAQLLASYRSRAKRSIVVSKYPVKE